MSRPKPDSVSADSVRGFYADILHFLRKRTDNANDAADMTQDVFTQWLDYRDRAQVEQPRAFLFQMARNLLRDHWRRQQVRSKVHQDAHPEESFDSEPLADEQHEPLPAAQRLQRLEQLKEVLAQLAAPPRSPYAAPLRRVEPGTDCQAHGNFRQHGGKTHRLCPAALQAASTTRKRQGAA